jgi:hypothetical protein
VLAPGGLLVFHLPSEPFPETGRAAARRSFVSGALPKEAFRARVSADVGHVEANAGHEIALKLRVRNDSRHAWPALAGASARHQITLAARFRTPDGATGRFARGAQPAPARPRAEGRGGRLPARGAAALAGRVPAGGRRRPGRRRVVPRALGARAAARSPAAPAGAPESPLLRTQSTPEPGSLRRRHPRAHFVLVRLLRVPVLLAAADRARSGIAWHARMAFWHAREAWTRFREPPMRMNGIPRPQVEELIRNAGGRLLEAESSELTFAGWQAYRYFVVRE